MKRKAVLIESSNVTGQADLPGARVDVENWQNFLKSPLGGSWASSEIVVLRKPMSADVEKHVAVSSDTYCFVAFSGHGEDGSVVLNDYRSDFPVSGLKPRGDRGVVVVDACRGVARGRLNFASQATALANMSLSTVVAHNSKEGRSSVFLESVIRNRSSSYSASGLWENGFGASKGIVEMMACSRGQAAQEDPTAGGYYTSLLLASADVWSKTNSYAPYESTKEAHDYAKANLPPQQTPQYAPEWLAYPFAVRA